MSSSSLEKEFIEKRINLIFGVVIVCFVIFFIGFWYLQVIRGPYYGILARENILKDEPVPAPRGLILDRNDRIIAENRLSHNLFITPQISRNLENTLAFVSGVLGVTQQELKKTIQKEGSLHSLRPVLLSRDLSLAQLAYISARKIEYPELDIKQETKRSYPYNDLMAHVIGYVGELTEEQRRRKEFPGAEARDTVGQSGLEKYYNDALTGENGYERKYVNSSGIEIKELPPHRKAAVPGKILRVGLDLNMQQAAHAAFEAKEESGAVVAVDIKSGEVLVLYNKPHYNPNDFIPSIAPARWRELISDPGHPLQNRVVQNKFSPGSTFKIVMALAALQERKITPDTAFFCGGSQFIYNRTFRCWKAGGHGYVSLHDAIVHSCDVYFYNLGMRMDIDVIARYSKMLGLGAASGIDLPNEVGGLVPTREWKQKAAGDKWYPGETISVAIGQGPILVTALQMADLMATVASKGIRIRPRLLDAVLESDGRIVKSPEAKIEKVTGINAENFEYVRRGLWGVVNERGTGTRAKLEGLDVCGKTGTVQVVGYDRGGDLAKREKSRFGDHAWFVAFAPLQDPQVAMAVFVEHGGHGSEAAAPVAKAIFEAYFQEKGLFPPTPPETPAVANTMDSEPQPAETTLPGNAGDGREAGR